MENKFSFLNVYSIKKSKANLLSVFAPFNIFVNNIFILDKNA